MSSNESADTQILLELYLEECKRQGELLGLKASFYLLEGLASLSEITQIRNEARKQLLDCDGWFRSTMDGRVRIYPHYRRQVEDCVTE